MALRAGRAALRGTSTYCGASTASNTPSMRWERASRYTLYHHGEHGRSLHHHHCPNQEIEAQH